MQEIIEIKGLSKSFGEVKAVRDLSFSVRRGELFAFLGTNGAGKSTTINIICGQLSRDGGEVRIGGVSIDGGIDEIKHSLGVVFQSSALDMPLTVRENLESRAALYGIFGSALEKRLSELDGLLQLAPLMNRRLGKLSGGERRRIDIARALIHKPSILILDEPTTGLDPQTRRLLWEVISDLRKTEGLTVLLTTHYMEEAAEADYVVIIEGGKIAAEGTPHELKNKYARDRAVLYGVTAEQVSELGVPYEEGRDFVALSLSSTAAATELIQKHPTLFTDYEITKGKMDDVFLAVTGRELQKEGK